MKIDEVLKSLRIAYQSTQAQCNRDIFIEMGWAIQRLKENNQLLSFDNFDNPITKQLIFDEMNWQHINDIYNID